MKKRKNFQRVTQERSKDHSVIQTAYLVGLPAGSQMGSKITSLVGSLEDFPEACRVES